MQLKVQRKMRRLTNEPAAERFIATAVTVAALRD
ncbi:hypothetical protein QF025_005560 [Paraburkholderia graminis]|jgi:hypothetical protein|uniref:Uncharacterized protein n=1 Tax=Paraburkholderia graminis TaxID=60548 RepID=A0ABD5CQM7_9BURK|nr:hypothetical protein [Paraburkholderia graminis]